MADWGARRPLTAADMDAVRARLRLADPSARFGAVRDLRSWQGRPVDADTARAVLRAATVAYPWVDSVGDDVGELLVQLLWTDPSVLDVSELERAYVFCAERGRRAILRTLALRADVQALGAVGHLMGLDGPWDLLPLPTPDLLRPLLDVPGVQRLASTLVLVAWRRGWAGHVADLLREMALRGLIDRDQSADICQQLAPLVYGLVDTCDRGATMSDRGSLVRADRERLSALMPLFGELDCDEAVDVLRRALACADPRVAATAVVAMAHQGELVGEDRLALLARDPEPRAILLEGLAPIGRGFDLPWAYRSSAAAAEADAVRWLASPSQLRCAPDDIEHRAALAAPPAWGAGVVHVFAFRVRPPHWSAERGWMLVAVGPFGPNTELMPTRADGFAVHSLYESEDGDFIERHLLAISEAVVAERGEEAV